jgi:hypothetical protein
MGKNDQIWFKAKKYGVGWGLPSTWQGWFVLLIYLLLIGTGAYFLATPPWLIPVYIGYVIFLSGILIWVCWKKGEKIDFRWGKK